MQVVRSQRWGYVRIIAGTIVGGISGFYVMHRLEVSYKAKWEERLKKYEQEKLRREKSLSDSEDVIVLADSPPTEQ